MIIRRECRAPFHGHVPGRVPERDGVYFRRRRYFQTFPLVLLAPPPTTSSTAPPFPPFLHFLHFLPSLTHYAGFFLYGPPSVCVARLIAASPASPASRESLPHLGNDAAALHFVFLLLFGACLLIISRCRARLHHMQTPNERETKNWNDNNNKARCNEHSRWLSVAEKRGKDTKSLACDRK